MADDKKNGITEEQIREIKNCSPQNWNRPKSDPPAKTKKPKKIVERDLKDVPPEEIPDLGPLRFQYGYGSHWSSKHKKYIRTPMAHDE